MQKQTTIESITYCFGVLLRFPVFCGLVRHECVKEMRELNIG
jgi:hypothetical protein